MQSTQYTIDNFSHLSMEEKLIVARLLKQKEYIASRKTFFNMYPANDTIIGIVNFHSRDKYPKHMEFFRAGKDYPERCAMCANRIGKSYGMGGYETAAHLTGIYQDWWPGFKFDRPIVAWAAGKNNETTRDVIQKILFGGIKFTGNLHFRFRHTVGDLAFLR